jgi:hypothetical protein
MKSLFRSLACVAALSLGFVAVADDEKPKAEAAKKADDAKAEKKKELTEQEQADLEYKKYIEAQQKAMAEMGKLASHAQTAEVKVIGSDKKTTLQTLALTADNRILALVAPPRSFGAPTKDATGEIQVFDAEGKKTDTWKLSFHGHSVNVAPDGQVYVAGDGKVQRFSKEGKAEGEPVELPHITELFKDKETLQKKAEETLKKEQDQRVEMYKQARTQFEGQIKKIEDIKEEDRTKAQTRQLEQAKQLIKTYEQMEKQESKRTVKDVIDQMASRVRTINGIAISEKDVFVACGETAGWGYAVWRFDRNLKEPKQVVKDLGGCCGQMDVQVSGADLIVAENTKHQFARYDREGKRLGGFGKRGTEGDPACFGGCCNPMNTRCSTGSGDIFTAESEGVVKRFSSTGAFIGVAGTVKISGGCKNVAIGVSADGEKIVFCDQPGSRFFILAKKPEGKSGGER